MKTLRQLFAAALATLVVLSIAAPPVAAQESRIAGVVGAAPGVRVDGFDVEQVTQIAPGTPLNFALYGSPGGSATARIEGAIRTLPLAEVQSGVYEGTYVVGHDDRIGPQSRVTASLWLATHEVTVVLEEALVLDAAQPSQCRECLVVEAIRPVDEMGRPGAMGAVTGGVIGAIVGNQFGHGDSRTAATILGAVGGAMVGREIERRQSTRTRYEVTVRGADGARQTRRYDAPPPFRVGDRIRLAGTTWVAEPSPVMP
jgi:outer membrane lipoprotein SlyB